MFRQVLLESAPGMRSRNTWPMATAFTLEMVIASVLVLIPLISTGVLPVTMQTPPVLAPSQYIARANPRPTTSAAATNSTGETFRVSNVVSVAPGNSHLIDWKAKSTPDQDSGPSQPPSCIANCNGKDLSPLFIDDAKPMPPVTPKHPIVVSRSMEAMLLNKVIPEYPNIARLAGITGDVKLHAIIAKDGTVQSLTVTSGPDMLREAALKAVAQWKYRPYYLNGEAVEVETVITVSFKRF